MEVFSGERGQAKREGSGAQLERLAAGKSCGADHCQETGPYPVPLAAVGTLTVSMHSRGYRITSPVCVQH